jgi:hypothetical protein
MTRCKPGDLAYIVRDPFIENVGRVVRVVAPAAPFGQDAAWRIAAEGAPFRVLDLVTMRSGYSNHGDCRDADLRPINGAAAAATRQEEVAT